MKELRIPLFRPATLAGITFALLPFLFTANVPLKAQDDLTPKVLELFEESCRECHHPDTEGELPDLHKGIKIADLLENPDDYLTLVPVVAGNIEESGVVHRSLLPDDSRKRMPKSKGAEGDDSYRAPLSEEQKKLLTDWVTAMKPGEAPTPTEPVEKPDPPKPVDLPEPEPETVAAASVEPEAVPENASMGDKVRFVFEERCASCHYPDNDFPDLSRSANLDLLMKKGQGGGSVAADIIDRITRPDDAKGRMPKSTGKPGDAKHTPGLSDEEKGILQAWADSANSESEKRDPIPFTGMVASIYNDVLANKSEARYFRYFTLTHLYSAVGADGEPQVDDATMDSHRAAIGKLINSLSMHGRITFPEAIDEARTIYRIDLRDYRWTDEDWEEIVAYYPHGMLGIDSQKESLIARETGSNMAYLRADWFAFAAAQPPLYHDILDRILELPNAGEAKDYLQRVEHRLGIDLKYNLQQGEAIRAGFNLSGVSSANRLIERHEIVSHRGAYWLSYDFKRRGADRRDSIMRAPLGPETADLTHDKDHMFTHDGGEAIYNLPNGLQAYALALSTGERIDRAPVDIVQDDHHPEKAIINGISCIRCHDQGIKPPIRVPVPAGWDVDKQGPKPNTLAGMKDEIGPAVDSARILDFKESALLKRLYPEPEVLRRVVLADFKHFSDAEEKATGGLRGALEPVAGLYEEYLRMVDSHRLSAELGMTRDEALTLLEEEKDRTESLAVLYNWLDMGNAERRETLLQDYLVLVYGLGFELMPFTPLGYEEFGGQEFADLIAESNAYVSIFGKANAPIKLAKEDAKKALVSSAGARKNLTRDRVRVPGGGHLEVSIQPKLVVGDKAELLVNTTEDVHMRIIHLSSDEFVTELYPGTTGRTTLLEKGKERVVTWTTTDPGGPEHVIVFASKQPIRIDDIEGAKKVGDFTVYERKNFFTSRGIPKNIRTEDVDEDSARPAAVVEAKVGYFLKD